MGIEYVVISSKDKTGYILGKGFEETRDFIRSSKKIGKEELVANLMDDAPYLDIYGARVIANGILEVGNTDLRVVSSEEMFDSHLSDYVIIGSRYLNDDAPFPCSFERYWFPEKIDSEFEKYWENIVEDIKSYFRRTWVNSKREKGDLPK